MEQKYDPQACQTDMMTLFGQTVRQYPHLPTREEQVLRARLMFEEGGVEMIKASGCQLVYCEGDDPANFKVLDLDRLKVVPIPDAEADEVAVADSVADTLVVTYGTANTYGQDAQGIYREVHRSNMTKVWPDGTIHKREDGKVLKPPTYSPANLAQELANQRWRFVHDRLQEAERIEEALASDDSKEAA